MSTAEDPLPQPADRTRLAPPTYRRFDTLAQYREALDELLGLAQRSIWLFDVSLDGAHYATGGSFPSVFEIAGITDWVAPATAGVTVRHWVVVQSNVQRSSGARVSDVLFCSFQTRTE